MSQKEETKTVVKYPLTALRKDCLTLFGVSKSTFDGATYGLSGNFSKEDIENRIAKWLNKEAK